MPLLKLRTRAKPKRPLTTLEGDLLNAMAVGPPWTRSPAEFPVDGITRADARRALSALWRRGLLTRVGWGDTAVYRRKL